MCGLAGLVWQSGKPTDIRRIVSSFSECIAHRGPDARGVLSAGNVEAVHWRLAILDLISGDQPMWSSDGRVALIFNGQIYNHAEIRRELKSCGYEFKTTSDTEVLIGAYLEWGDSCIDRFNGMWAFVLVDFREGRWRVLCSRDRMGIKPFYYAHTPDCFAFASELKSFDQLERFDACLNVHALNDYLVFGPRSGGSTIVQGVNELPPAHNLVIQRDGSVHLTRYWSLEDTFGSSDMPVLSDLEELVIDAVNLRLLADVPVATINSGGLDSSLISAISVRSVKDLRTYSVAPDRNSDGSTLAGDESKEAQYLADWIGSRHVTVRYDPALLVSEASNVAYLNDGEVFHSNTFPMDVMFKRISADGFKVVLGGEGADEIFRGYSSERLLNLVKPFGLPLLELILKRRKRSVGYLRPYVRSLSGMIGHVRQSRFSPSLASQLTGTQFEILSERSRHFSIMDSMDQHSALAYYEQATYLSGLLRRADRMSMKSGVELRVPFLDHRIVERLNRIPAKYKAGVIRKREKTILRQIGARYLPRKIARRPKYGFGTPVSLLYPDLLGHVSQQWGPEGIDSLNSDQIWILATALPNWLGGK